MRQASLTLVVGPRRLGESIAGPLDIKSLTFVKVPEEALAPRVEDPGAMHTLRLDWRVRATTTVTNGRLSRSVPWEQLFEGMLAGDALGGIAMLTPLWLLARDADGAHVFVALRHMVSDALFVRLHAEPFDDSSDAELSRVAAELHRKHSLFLNNHQCYYRRLFPGEEIEHKYTLPLETDIWETTLRLYQVVREGDWAGFIPEYADEFQAWDYLNYLFAVPEPPEERGYVSFIPLSTGGYTIKRKWFAEDATRRGEKYQPAPAGLTDLDAYIRDTLGLTSAQRMPTFRRVRYDLNFESMRTGHVYGIFFDRSMTVDGPAAQLVQCELEYLRTRSILPLEESEVLRELDEVAFRLEGFLAAEGFPTERGVYSKLSFLRDVVRDGTSQPLSDRKDRP